MSKHKPKRGVPAIDMTAMVDVAFLLLTFFILTTTSFREDASIQVDAPTSVSQTPTPEKSLTTIFVSDSGDVFVGFSDIRTRERVLANAIQNNKIPKDLSEKAAKDFVAMENFGLPFAAFKTYLDGLSPEERKKTPQPGISAKETDTVAHTGNELKEWIFYARYADSVMKFTVKGDKNAPYSSVKNVINTLQDAKINHFGLITNLESGGAKEKPAGEEKK